MNPFSHVLKKRKHLEYRFPTRFCPEPDNAFSLPQITVEEMRCPLLQVGVSPSKPVGPWLCHGTAGRGHSEHRLNSRTYSHRNSGTITHTDWVPSFSKPEIPDPRHTLSVTTTLQRTALDFRIQESHVHVREQLQ